MFGFHLATVDLRQSSDKHEAVVAELLARRAHRGRLRARSTRRRKRALLLRAARRRAAAARARRRATASTRASELAIFEAARADARSASAAQAIRHYIICHTETVSDLLEVLLLQKEVGPAARHAGRRRRDRDLIVVPLFETIGDLRNARRSCASSTRCPASRR